MAVDRKKMWVGWTRDAISQYDPPAKVTKLKPLIEDMTAFTTAYADAMLEEFEERFEGKARISRDEDPEEEEEEEEEEEDEDDE